MWTVTPQPTAHWLIYFCCQPIAWISGSLCVVLQSFLCQLHVTLCKSVLSYILSMRKQKNLFPKLVNYSFSMLIYCKDKKEARMKCFGCNQTFVGGDKMIASTSSYYMFTLCICFLYLANLLEIGLKDNICSRTILFFSSRVIRFTIPCYQQLQPQVISESFTAMVIQYN